MSDQVVLLRESVVRVTVALRLCGSVCHMLTDAAFSSKIFVTCLKLCNMHHSSELRCLHGVQNDVCLFYLTALNSAPTV